MEIFVEINLLFYYNLTNDTFKAGHFDGKPAETVIDELFRLFNLSNIQSIDKQSVKEVEITDFSINMKVNFRVSLYNFRFILKLLFT
jgi:hypothetical protein